MKTVSYHDQTGEVSRFTPRLPGGKPHGFQAFERLARTAPGGGAVSAVSQVVEAARCARRNGGMEVSWGYPLITQVMTMTEY